MAADQVGKITTLNITEGAGGTRIDRWKYDAMRRAILLAIPRDAPGLAFSELPDAVTPHLPLNWAGSVGWYVTTVKLDLEARGEIERVSGAKPQRLVRIARKPRG